MSPDIIITLPQDIIEAILCLLPTKQALRTSVLSRGWRYKWTTIPKLVFSTKHEASMTYFLRSVRQVLLLHNGPIHEFSLTMYDDFYTRSDVDQVLLDQILLFLSKNHVLTSLALEVLFSWYDLPLFVCNGFGSLISLSLEGVRMCSETVLQVLSNSPSLKNFRLILVPDLLLQELPTTLNYLKYICIEGLDFSDDKELIFFAALIKCSPNLEKIEIAFGPGIKFEDTVTNILKQYSDVKLEHLIESEYNFYTSFKLELELLKFILARSPKLKRVSIHCSCDVEEDQESEVLETLLQIPRVSPAEINVSFQRVML